MAGRYQATSDEAKFRVVEEIEGDEQGYLGGSFSVWGKTENYQPHDLRDIAATLCGVYVSRCRRIRVEIFRELPDGSSEVMIYGVTRKGVLA